MKFGVVGVDEAEGAIIAHAVRRPGLIFKKGERLSRADVAALKQAGVQDVIAAQIEASDVGEDEAAHDLAEAAAGQNIRVDRAFTGRANLFATKPGVLVIDAAAVDAINAQDEAVTVATLANMRAVVAGEMVATVKIIPFAVPKASLAAAISVCKQPILTIAAYRPLRIGVISTLLPGLKPTVVDKTIRVLQRRLDPAGATIVTEKRVPHETAVLAPVVAAMADTCDLTIVFGASAITDRRDVIPAAIEKAHGIIEHFGMPVDPGNLLLLGRSKGGRPILGAPGCARSPKENGFDYVLQRILADVPVTSADIRAMGVGGLLMEIVSRPQPRTGDEPQDDPQDESPDQSDG